MRLDCAATGQAGLFAQCWQLEFWRVTGLNPRQKAAVQLGLGSDLSSLNRVYSSMVHLSTSGSCVFSQSSSESPPDISWFSSLQQLIKKAGTGPKPSGKLSDRCCKQQANCSGAFPSDRTRLDQAAPGVQVLRFQETPARSEWSVVPPQLPLEQINCAFGTAKLTGPCSKLLQDRRQLPKQRQDMTCGHVQQWVVQGKASTGLPSSAASFDPNSQEPGLGQVISKQSAPP